MPDKKTTISADERWLNYLNNPTAENREALLSSNQKAESPSPPQTTPAAALALGLTLSLGAGAEDFPIGKIMMTPGVLCPECRQRVLGLLAWERQKINQAIARKEGEIAGIDYALTLYREPAE
jgi:hypothetical protein